MASLILLAGATGDLGGRILSALLTRGASVRILVRSSTDAAKIDELTRLGAQVIALDLDDADALKQACLGVDCVVSALAGLQEVILTVQSQLLTAAIAAGVPRFIPSDFASDYTKLPQGLNRNFDLRRAFQVTLDQAPIAATSILNGAFGEILTYNIPLLNLKQAQVGYWEDADWRVDFTTMDDTAAFTAAAALDNAAPRWLRIASFQISPRELSVVAETVYQKPFSLVRLGSRAELTQQMQQLRAANPAGEQELYANWQRLQYLLSMFSVQNSPLDNGRYPDLSWTSVERVLATQPS